MLLYYFLSVLIVSLMAPAPPAVPPVGPRDPQRFDYCASREANLRFLDRNVEATARAGRWLHPLRQANQQLVRDAIVIAGSMPDQASCREAFRAGAELYRGTLAPIAAQLRREMTSRHSQDDAKARLQMEIGAQWLFDETIRQVLVTLPPASEGAAARWARALADARMRQVAADSAFIVSKVHYGTDGVDPREFGSQTAWQADQLAMRYGVAATQFGASGR